MSDLSFRSRSAEPISDRCLRGPHVELSESLPVAFPRMKRVTVTEETFAGDAFLFRLIAAFLADAARFGVSTH